jgi:hypothetical protein
VPSRPDKLISVDIETTDIGISASCLRKDRKATIDRLFVDPGNIANRNSRCTKGADLSLPIVQVTHNWQDKP